MAVMDRPFTTANEILTNFNWTDVADGTGVQSFYLGIGKTSSGEFYTLDKNILRTSVTVKSGAMTGTTITKVIDLDFDTSVFKVSRTIRGKVNSGFSWSQYEDAGAIAAEGYVVVILKKVATDGTTETTIATMQSPTASGGDVRLYLTDFVEATVTETTIAVGEKLRVTVEVWLRQTAGTGQPGIQNYLYVDPENSESGDTAVEAGDTQFFINIPFNIE